MAAPAFSERLSHETNSGAFIVPWDPAPIVLSHRELLRRVLSFQKKLVAIGITYGDVVAIALPNGLELFVSFLATIPQRAICALLNPGYKHNEFEFYLNNLDTAFLLVPEGAIAENREAIKAAEKCNTPAAEVVWDWCEWSLPEVKLRGSSSRVQATVHLPHAHDVALILCWLRRFQLLYLPRNTGSSIYSADQSRPYR